MPQIYRHISPSGRSYIGQTKHTWQVRAMYNRPLLAYASSIRFYNAISKYGWENFIHEVLEEGDFNQPELNEKEYYWIKYYNTAVDGYNIYGGGTKSTLMSDISEELCIEICKLYSSGYSTRECVAEYSLGSATIIAILRKYKIPAHPNGHQSPLLAKRRFENSYKARAEEVKCSNPNCKNLIKKTRDDTKKATCSKSCAGFLGSLSIMNNGLDKREEIRRKISVAAKDNKNSVGNRGGLITSHLRWHIRRDRISKDCELCIAET